MGPHRARLMSGGDMWREPFSPPATVVFARSESRSPVEGRHDGEDGVPGARGRWTVARKVGPGFNYRNHSSGHDTTDTDVPEAAHNLDDECFT